MNEVIEVERGNKIIAEFDGWVKTNDTVLGGAFWYKKERTTKLLYQMQYHSSWDWQVPVWGKIALAVKELIVKIPDSEENAKWYFRLVGKYENFVYLNKPNEGQKIIVELIQWYNQNKDK